jgi:hypothetical protein
MFSFKTGNLAKLFTPDAKNKYATKGSINSIVSTMYFFFKIIN